MEARLAQHIGRIRRELSFIQRDADKLDDYEAADSLHKSVDFILRELENLELKIPAADDLHRAA
jgi:hypothetical protein